MKAREDCRPHITSIPGPSLNPNTRKILKNVRFLIENSRSFRNRTDLVLWHYKINNTPTKHRSNHFRHCDQDRFRFEAIVYCTRKGAPWYCKKFAENRYLGNPGNESHYSQTKTAWLLVFEAVQRITSRGCTRIEDFEHHLATSKELTQFTEAGKR